MKIILCVILLMPVMVLGVDHDTYRESAPPTLPMMSRSDTILFEDFDGVVVGELPTDWDTMDLTGAPMDAYWHIDSYQAQYGDSCWWCGANIASWPAEPGYGNLWRQYLTLAVDLSGVTDSCALRFDHRYDMEQESPEVPFDTWDACNVRVQTPGSPDWVVLGAYQDPYPYQAAYAFNLQDGDTLPGFSGSGLTWSPVGFDLTPYIGDSLYIRFWVASDMYCSDEDFCDFDGAWFLDNIFVGHEGDTAFFTDCESGPAPELLAEGYPAFVTGNFWSVIDSLHQPQPDGRSVSYSAPQSAYCGDTTSIYGNGTYTPAQHGGHGLSNALVTPTLDFSAYNTILLTFMQRGFGDGSGGYGYIDVSTDDGATWTELEMQNFQPAGGDWEFHFWDLSSAGGEPDVKVRFRAGSGTAAYHYVYWYVDDISITGSGSQCWAQVDDDDPVWYWGDFTQGEVGAIKLENCQNGGGLLDQARMFFYSPSITNSGDFAIHVYEHNEISMFPGADLMVPETITVDVPYYQEWVTLDLRDKNVRLDTSQVFWLGVEKLGMDDCTVLLDTLVESGMGNAIYYQGLWQISGLSGDFMFRTLIDSSSIGVAEGAHATGPGRLELFQNHPNPVRNGVTTILYSLPSPAHVSLKLYDASGRLVRDLFEGSREAGTFAVDWNGTDDQGRPAANGVYFYLLSTDQSSSVRKLTVVR